MIIKVAYVGEGMFQVGDSDIPYDETSLLQLVQSYADLDDVQALNWIDKVKQSKQGSFEEKKANKGVIVDLYEVEYPTPANPLKETEDLASHLDERKDFVTQYLFTGNETKDITVGLAKDLVKGQPQQPVPKNASQKGWRTILSWEMPVEQDWTPTIIARLKRYVLPIWKKFNKEDAYGDRTIGFDDYTTSQWLTLMNTILVGIGPEAWAPPENEFPQPGEKGNYSIPGIQLSLDYDEDIPGKRRADLLFDNEDHTPWVIETGKGTGRYKNYDIGGS